LGERYRYVDVLGEGTFGRVLRVTHVQSGEEYAMKVVKAVKRHTENARIEAQILLAVQGMRQ
jgi:serine/threonine protein kinase